MKILKKIFSTILLNVFIIISVSPVWALTYSNDEYNYENTLIKETIELQYNIKKISSWDKYIKSIDNFISKINTDEEKLENLQIKIFELQNKLSNATQTTKIKNYIDIVNYINTKINLELYRIQNKNNISLVEQKEIELKNKIEEINNSSLSDNDTKIVNEKLIQIQLNLLEKAESNLDFLIDNFKEISNYEQKWDFKLTSNINHELIWNIKSEFNINNYINRTSNFDSQFTWQIEAIIDAIPNWWEEIKLKLSSFVDFISKDWNMYLLIEKFNITDEKGIENIKEQFELVKKIAEENKYIKFEDENTKLILENLKNLDPNKIISDSKQILSEPMFEAYKKENNKYFLVPTKYACDKYKELAEKFDPWNGSSCSDSQYDSMIEELIKFWDLYIEIWTESKLGFNAYPENTLEKFESYITFTDTSINEINSEFIINQTKWFKLEYIKNKKLDFQLNIWDEKQVFLNSKLDKNNQFTFLDFQYNLELYKETFNGELKVENKQLNWNFKITNQKYYWYDYETWESNYKPGDIISWIIIWKQDYKNVLNTLNIKISWVDADTNKQFLKAELSKKYDDYNIILEISNNNTPIFNLDLGLNNTKIYGNTSIFNKDWKEYLKITHSWKYYTDFFELNNNIEFFENPLNIFWWYSQDAKNAKINSDLRTIVSAIEISYVRWDIISLNELIIWNNKINFALLNQNWDDFKHPDWTDYLIFTKEIEVNWQKNEFYQLYWVTVDYDWNKIAQIKWNYVQMTDSDTESLVIINWKIIKYWDIVWKINIEEKDKIIIESNFNIKIDTTRNNNNINFYLDYTENEEKIIEFEVDNTSTIYYKNSDIKAPTNTIDLSEAMWIK